MTMSGETLPIGLVGLRGVGGFGDDLVIRLALQEPPISLPNDRVVVDEKNCGHAGARPFIGALSKAVSGMRATTRTPFVASLIDRLPPKAAMRSRIPRMPWPEAAGEAGGVAAAVILDRQRDEPVVRRRALDAQIDVFRVAVPHGVGQTFLRDAIEARRNRLRKVGEVAREPQVDDAPFVPLWRSSSPRAEQDRLRAQVHRGLASAAGQARRARWSSCAWRRARLSGRPRRRPDRS